MITQIKARIFVRNVWNGILGITFETFLAFIFIAAGFIVCFLWWSFFK